MQRPRANPDLQFVFHPEADAGYRHFDGHEAVPFDPGAATVTRANAWWLAEAALLAYWDPDEARQRFAAAGLAAGARRERRGAGVPSPRCRAPSWSRSAETERDRLGDAFDDARFGLVRATHGSVHEGFRDALDRVWTALLARLTPLAASRTVWFSAHSLGAALATLAADRLPTTAGVCPNRIAPGRQSRVRGRLDARFGARAARYVDDADMVTQSQRRFPSPTRTSANCDKSRPTA